MNRKAFTLVELLTVIAVIAILAGMVLSVAGPIQKKSAKAKALGEIMAFSAACESYKADNGNYPRDTVTDDLDARSANPGSYRNASLFLYKELTGDTNADGEIKEAAELLKKSYIEIKPGWCGRANSSLPPSVSNPVTHLMDPFGSSYGYSTACQKWMDDGSQAGSEKGYSPTFDMWCTAGNSRSPSISGDDKVTVTWVKNW